MTEKENNQQSIIEDLTVNEAEAKEVKGGPIYMKIEGVSGDVTASGYEKWIESSSSYDLQLKKTV